MHSTVEWKSEVYYLNTLKKINDLAYSRFKNLNKNIRKENCCHALVVFT